MNIRLKFLTLALALLIAILALAACNGGKNNDSDIEPDSDVLTGADAPETEITYNGINVDDYVQNVKYKDMEIVWDASKTSKEDAVWNAIYATVTVTDYPDDKVNYYFNQMKDAYMHCANGNEADYLLLLKARGTSEEDMLNKSREMVKEDLVYRYIIKHEEIELTDGEKSELFDKYVEKYSLELGKDTAYVAANMEEYIYESMLYDKTTEYLFSVNTFVTGK